MFPGVMLNIQRVTRRPMTHSAAFTPSPLKAQSICPAPHLLRAGHFLILNPKKTGHLVYSDGFNLLEKERLEYDHLSEIDVPLINRTVREKPPPRESLDHQAPKKIIGWATKMSLFVFTQNLVVDFLSQVTQ
jgi:hypothetical protein